MNMENESTFYMCDYFTDISKEYGLLEAILLNYIYKWVIRNKQLNINYFNGFYWMFRGSRLMAKDIGGISYKSIQRTLLKMQEYNLILIGNYNKNPKDTTKWYTLTTKGLHLIENHIKSERCI